jgi:hypothetical protein
MGWPQDIAESGGGWLHERFLTSFDSSPCFFSLSQR